MSDPFGHHSGQYVNNFSEAENKQFTVAFGEITQGFKVAMEQGLPTSDEAVQQLVKRHYEFCLQFWKPNRESYKSLAMSYIIPSPYQEAYEAVAKGLGKYHYDAIVLFADNNLQ
ncbi:MAG: TipAS antibiotic-recognition domain-containing protein [Actinobacteria bacterium]|jgi:hypothetical protein|uniref:Unannotated protein n=1 Tax=freshwater metagenome TaxID=449393 RepID=A0A6J6JL54_9ZZZZ|nr:TipAS antibiotic-recognition domain-containing protein [Actinomycetota bacterium]